MKLYHIRWSYGLTREAYESMLAGQGNTCAVCGSSVWGIKGPVVDHDHATGEVRGIICHKCNVAIGLLGDNPKTVRAVADYLERR